MEIGTQKDKEGETTEQDSLLLEIGTQKDKEGETIEHDSLLLGIPEDLQGPTLVAQAPAAGVALAASGSADPFDVHCQNNHNPCLRRKRTFSDLDEILHYMQDLYFRSEALRKLIDIIKTHYVHSVQYPRHKIFSTIRQAFQLMENAENEIEGNWILMGIVLTKTIKAIDELQAHSSHDTSVERGIISELLDKKDKNLKRVIELTTPMFDFDSGSEDALVLPEDYDEDEWLNTHENQENDDENGDFKDIEILPASQDALDVINTNTETVNEGQYNMWILQDALPECSICHVTFGLEDKISKLPNCGHSFHYDCIMPWMEKTHSCPLCRVTVEP